MSSSTTHAHIYNGAHASDTHASSSSSASTSIPMTTDEIGSVPTTPTTTVPNHTHNANANANATPPTFEEVIQSIRASFVQRVSPSVVASLFRSALALFYQDRTQVKATILNNVAAAWFRAIMQQCTYSSLINDVTEARSVFVEVWKGLLDGGFKKDAAQLRPFNDMLRELAALPEEAIDEANKIVERTKPLLGDPQQYGPKQVDDAVMALHDFFIPTLWPELIKSVIVLMRYKLCEDITKLIDAALVSPHLEAHKHTLWYMFFTYMQGHEFMSSSTDEHKKLFDRWKSKLTIPDDHRESYESTGPPPHVSNTLKKKLARAQAAAEEAERKSNAASASTSAATPASQSTPAAAATTASTSLPNPAVPTRWPQLRHPTKPSSVAHAAAGAPASSNSTPSESSLRSFVASTERKHGRDDDAHASQALDQALEREKEQMDQASSAAAGKKKPSMQKEQHVSSKRHNQTPTQSLAADGVDDIDDGMDEFGTAEGSPQESEGGDEDEDDVEEFEESASSAASAFRPQEPPPPEFSWSPAKLSALNEELAAFYAERRLTPAEVTLRHQLLNRLSMLVSHRLDPSLTCVAFGSSASGLAMKGSDLDVAIVNKGTHTSTDFQRQRARPLMNKLTKIARESKYGFTAVQPVLHARVPILKLVDKASGVSVDIALGQDSTSHKSALMSAYARMDPRVVQLLLFVKQWAQSKDVNDASRNTLNSFGYALMVVQYLQLVKPPILPSLQQQVKKVEKEEEKMGLATAATKEHAPSSAAAPSNTDNSSWKLSTHSTPSLASSKAMLAEFLQREDRYRLFIDPFQMDRTQFPPLGSKGSSRNGSSPKSTSPRTTATAATPTTSPAALAATGPTLGELLLGFFHFYSYIFDSQSMAICIRSGSLLQKQSLVPYLAQQKTRTELIISDPYDPSDNVARGITPIVWRQIRQAMKQAYAGLVATGKLHDILKQETVIERQVRKKKKDLKREKGLKIWEEQQALLKGWTPRPQAQVQPPPHHQQQQHQQPQHLPQPQQPIQHVAASSAPTSDAAPRPAQGDRMAPLPAPPAPSTAKLANERDQAHLELLARLASMEIAASGEPAAQPSTSSGAAVPTFKPDHTKPKPKPKDPRPPKSFKQQMQHASANDGQPKQPPSKPAQAHVTLPKNEP